MPTTLIPYLSFDGNTREVFAFYEKARGAASADALRDLVPGSGHLLHMPAHIDLRTGRYAQAIAASRRAIAADERYLAAVDAQGAHHVGYVAHNHHYLWAAAAMAGDFALALQAAQAAYPAACGPSGLDPGRAIARGSTRRPPRRSSRH